MRSAATASAATFQCIPIQHACSLALTVVHAARALSAVRLQLLHCAQASAHCGTRGLGFCQSDVLRALQFSGVAFGPDHPTIEGAAGPASEVIVGAARHLVPLVRRSAVVLLSAAASVPAAHRNRSRGARRGSRCVLRKLADDRRFPVLILVCVARVAAALGSPPSAALGAARAADLAAHDHLAGRALQLDPRLPAAGRAARPVDGGCGARLGVVLGLHAEQRNPRRVGAGEGEVTGAVADKRQKLPGERRDEGSAEELRREQGHRCPCPLRGRPAKGVKLRDLHHRGIRPRDGIVVRGRRADGVPPVVDADGAIEQG